ncbi:MAG: hypothetical protein LBP76_12400 [Treponema sp.]|nr:hypothetical protein [Treponema sp.]
MIETEHFEIIYPKESEATAQSLALFADRAYEEVSSLLGISLKRKTPVCITPHTDQFNGYMNPLPYPHIVLHDTPINIEDFGLRNPLEGIFIHEMTHAVSLSSRGPFFSGLHRIFGGWASPTGLTAPLFMVEGVTVSFESLNGAGRAHDPLITSRLRQALLDGKFLSPFQAAGVYDLPPSGKAYYEYGGLFNTYLIRRYGMEKYARLWQDMGRRIHFSIFFYNHGFFNSFKRVYGFQFMDAWEDFKESLRIHGVADNESGTIVGGKTLIGALGAGNGKVYFLDTLSHKLKSYNPADGKMRNVLSAGASAYDFDMGADDRILLSSYRSIAKLATAVVTEYRGGFKTGRVWKGLYRGHYFRDGVTGLSSVGHFNNLVFRSGAEPRREEVLLRGNAELIYGSLQALDDSRILFTLMREGVRKLCLYNYDTGAVYTLVSDLEDDRERWAYIRSLQLSGNKVFFSYNHNDRLYKPAFIDLAGIAEAEKGIEGAGLEAVFSEKDFSGGVFSPVTVDGGTDIYYQGAFSTWDKLMRYPETLGEFSGLRVKIRLEPWNESLLAAAAPDRAVPAGGGAAAEPSLPVFAGRRPALPGDPPDGGIPAKKYFPLKYFNPFQLWIPFPMIGTQGNDISLNGGGIFSFLTDPADSNLIFVTAGMDKALFAAVSVDWTNYSLIFPINFTFSDQIDRSQSFMYRRTQAGLSATFEFPLGGERSKLSLMGGFGVALFAVDPDGEGGAYTWPFKDEPSYSVSAGLGFSTLRHYTWELYGRGLLIKLRLRHLLNRESPRLDGIIQAAFDPYFPFRLSLYAAWDNYYMDLHGNSYQLPQVLFNETTSVEYSTEKITRLSWIAGGQAELKLFSFEIQNNVSHLYFNRLFAGIAYRSVLYDRSNLPYAEGSPLNDRLTLAQSAVLRLGSSVSTAALTALPLTVTPTVWGAWKFSNYNDENDRNDFAIGMYLSVRY